MSGNCLINLSFLLAKPTGISVYATQLLPYLKPLQPTLLIGESKTGYSCYSIPNNLTPDRGIKGHSRRLIWTQFELPRIYEKLESRLVFSPVPEAPLYTSCRYIVMVHDVIPLRFPKLTSPLTHYFRFYVPSILHQAEHIICNSQATASDVMNFFGIPAAKITPIPLAYDRRHFCYLPESSLCRGEAQQKRYFLYIGRHDPYKNIHRLIDAFAGLSKKGEYELWIAGSTDKRYTPKLQTHVEELGLRTEVQFLDYVAYDALPNLIRGAIALVFPSLWEGFGLPILEAMACGTPVITSKLSSLPEVTADAAILVNPYSTAELTAAMDAIATSEELRSHFRTLSLKQASLFSWEKTGQATVEVLKEYL